ncbi:MAG: Uma2 family endonuclease [Acidobacteriaceae bacterium]|nr:Uma2 family endonuclease [Acidobacteriaceae bacterium]MBV8570890.1 Uma2 family endonuclease [Acidobacteriaceae bacterium]
MSAASSRIPITVEQYEHFEGYPGLRDELIYGRIAMSPPPKPLHQQIAQNIDRLLNALSETTPYIARQATSIKFPALNSMPAPDVFIVRRDDWLKACRDDVYLDVAPILVVEVISPANRKSRVEQKIGIYRSSGVQEVWIVHPKKRTVRVCTESDEKLYTADDSIALTALTGTIQLSDVFRLE